MIAFDPEIQKLVSAILLEAVRGDAVELFVSPPVVRHRVGTAWTEHPEIPAQLQSALLDRFLILAELPLPAIIEPGRYPNMSHFSFESDGVEFIAGAKLYKERGRHSIHIRLMKKSDQLFFNAVARNDLAAVKAAIDGGQAVDAENPRGETPLYAAAANRHLDMAALLLDHGAEVNGRSRFGGGTPIMQCIYDARGDMTRLLAARGADLDARDAQGHPAIFRAMVKRQEKTALLLIELGARVNVCVNGVPLVKCAANMGCEDAVRAMLARGAEGLDADAK